jgi:assimilatory nitrate reductase catalytic subunit
LLLPGAKAPVALQSRGKPVCTCFGVTDTEIGTCLTDITTAAGGAGYLASDDERLAALQDKLKCGTNCGSCLPEIKRIVRTATEARHATAGSAPGERTVIPIRVVA